MLIMVKWKVMVLQPNKKINKNKRNALTLVTILLVVISGYFVFAYTTKQAWPFTKSSLRVETSRPTTNTLPPSNNSSNPPHRETTEDNPTKTPPQFDGDDPNDSPQLTISINYIGVSDKSLLVRTTIDQTISSGTCRLVLSRTGAPSITKLAEVTANPSSATCTGFDVPISELSSGSWMATITVTDGTREGTATKGISI